MQYEILKNHYELKQAIYFNVTNACGLNKVIYVSLRGFVPVAISNKTWEIASLGIRHGGQFRNAEAIPYSSGNKHCRDRQAPIIQ